MPESFSEPAASPSPASATDPTGLPGVGVRPSWEPWAFGILLILFIGFGYNVLHRSAFSTRQRTDAGVFFRAGYAVRERLDPYVVSDENEWFFLYPPGVAAFFVPLADPPTLSTPTVETFGRSSRDKPAADGAAVVDKAANVRPVPTRETITAPYLPYTASVVAWYAVSVALFVLTIHWLVTAMQRLSPDPNIRALSPRHGGWWNIRFWPLIVCLPDALSTLSRGQITFVLLASMGLGVHFMARRKPVLGGFCWAFAAFVKVFPGLLVFHVFARRSWKAFAGYVICFVVTMIALPLVVFGPSRAIDYTHTFVDRVLLAGLGQSDQPGLQAGANPDNWDNQSIQGSLHNLINIATPRGDRPMQLETWVQLTHALGFIVLLVASLWPASRRRDDRPPGNPALELVLRVGMLCCVMFACSPMTHRHYLVLLLPAVTGLVFANIMTSRLGFLRGWGMVVFPLIAVAATLPKQAQTGILRDLPIPLVITLVVWGICWCLVRRLNIRREALL